MSCTINSNRLSNRVIVCKFASKWLEKKLERTGTCTLKTLCLLFLFLLLLFCVHSQCEFTSCRENKKLSHFFLSDQVESSVKCSIIFRLLQSVRTFTIVHVSVELRVFDNASMGALADVLTLQNVTEVWGRRSVILSINWRTMIYLNWHETPWVCIYTYCMYFWVTSVPLVQAYFISPFSFQLQCERTRNRSHSSCLSLSLSVSSCSGRLCVCTLDTTLAARSDRMRERRK